MQSPEPRPRYRPSGRFDRQRLAIAALLLLALSAVIAAGYVAQLSLLYLFMVLSAIFPVFALGWGLHRGVHSAHLRIPGLAADLGNFHLDHYLRWLASPLAIDKLSAYIPFRMETDPWN
jgi:hypothetical protein